jgi:hypothetical protein
MPNPPLSDPIWSSANDWELAFLGGVAFARGGGAGIYFSLLRSRAANCLEPFYLTATGVGAGGNCSGFDPNNMRNLNFSALRVITPFAAGTIHLSAGFLISGSVGALGLNYGYTSLNAGRNGVTFFETSGTGPSMGSGSGAYAFAGLWYSHRLNNNSINPFPAYGESVRRTVEDLLREWERGIRNIYNVPGY